MIKLHYKDTKIQRLWGYRMTGKFDDVGIPIIIWNKGKKEWETIYMPKMTEKRFKYIIFDGFEDNGKEMSPQEVEETLNKFQELSMEDYKKIKRLEKENKELKEENEQLKIKLENVEDARKSYKEDWKACTAYCDEYKNEIHDLKDNINGLLEKNEQLKQEINMLKTTIGRNEEYIDRLTHKGEWR